jgi:hypothetical protein
MTAVDTRLRQVLPYLIHTGLVELRLLGYENAPHEQIAKLADVLEFLPRYLEPDGKPAMEVIREQFEQYAAEFPQSRFAERYFMILDGSLSVTNY